MTQIVQSAVREFLVDHIGTLPPAIRVECFDRDGKYEVTIRYDGQRIWHVPPIDPDSVMDVLDEEIEFVEQRIHRLATTHLMGAW